MLYCYACHGEKGDGQGPGVVRAAAAAARLHEGRLQVRPAALAATSCRTTTISSGSSTAASTARRCCRGTSPRSELDKIIQYMKTFSPQKWEKRKKSGDLVQALEPFEPAPDPWVGKQARGVQRGKELYHLRAECMNCHPAYDTKESLYKLSLEAAAKEPDQFKAIGGFRDDPYGSVAKDAPAYKGSPAGDRRSSPRTSCSTRCGLPA